MAEVTPPRPLAETDDRDSFDCGRDSMNHWFRRHAWVNHAGGLSRTNVICGGTANQIIGYVTLSAAQIERASLVRSQQRNKPDPVPATLLGQLAVHKDHQGGGYASELLLFALRIALRASQDVGSWGVIAHPLDDHVRAFYVRRGFQELPFDPRRAMVVRMADLDQNGIGTG
ncbi:MAG: GNAT family N-acetyltransferase [Alphaproteobacteria bacterium]